MNISMYSIPQESYRIHQADNSKRRQEYRSSIGLEVGSPDLREHANEHTEAS